MAGRLHKSPGAGNIYYGGTGNDTLKGTCLADLYHFNRGDGHDTLTELDVPEQPPGEIDVLRFGPDVMPNEVGIGRVGTALRLTLANGSDSVTFNSWYNSSGSTKYQVERIEFDNGVVWLNDYLSMQGLEVHGTAAAETINGVSAWANRLFGEGGNDTLIGESLADILVGGAGNDSLQGRAGNDIYRYWAGDGLDTVTDSYGTDTLVFEDIPLDNAQFSRKNDDLVIALNEAASQGVVVKNHFYNSNSKVEVFEFDDLTYTAAQVESLILIGIAP